MAKPTTPPLGGKYGWWPLLVVPALAAGCTITESSLWKTEQPIPCQIATTWEKKVAYAADPTQGGKMNPGFAGRLYVFDINGKPITADGSLTVNLYDESNGSSVMVEQWTIDPATLSRLMRQDIFGCGYSLFLPSGRYKPGMTSIRMQSAYTRKNAAPIYTDNVVALAPENGVIRESIRPGTYPQQVSRK